MFPIFRLVQRVIIFFQHVLTIVMTALTTPHVTYVKLATPGMTVCSVIQPSMPLIPLQGISPAQVCMQLTKRTPRNLPERPIVSISIAQLIIYYTDIRLLLIIRAIIVTPLW